jgi:hypothetical protein
LAVSKRLRFEILRRDNHCCRYCGAKGPDVPLRVDHVVPVALGGSDDPSNLVTACEPCNSGKSSVPADAPLVADVAADAIRWARAMEQAAEELSAEADVLDGICDAIAKRWRPRWIPSDFANSVYAFVKAGLTEADLLDLVDVALFARGVDDRWAYFCGCCWKRIKQRQERAAEIVGRDAEVPPTMSTTRWTALGITEKCDAALKFASRYMRPDEVDCVACTHRDVAHCGDPVCAVEWATTLEWLAVDRSNELSRAHLRDERIMDELESVDG